MYLLSARCVCLYECVDSGFGLTKSGGRGDNEVLELSDCQDIFR